MGKTSPAAVTAEVVQVGQLLRTVIAEVRREPAPWRTASLDGTPNFAAALTLQPVVFPWLRLEKASAVAAKHHGPLLRWLAESCRQRTREWIDELETRLQTLAEDFADGIAPAEMIDQHRGIHWARLCAGSPLFRLVHDTPGFPYVLGLPDSTKALVARIERAACAKAGAMIASALETWQQSAPPDALPEWRDLLNIDPALKRFGDDVDPRRAPLYEARVRMVRDAAKTRRLAEAEARCSAACVEALEEAVATERAGHHSPCFTKTRTFSPRLYWLQVYKRLSYADMRDGISVPLRDPRFTRALEDLIALERSRDELRTRSRSKRRPRYLAAEWTELGLRPAVENRQAITAPDEYGSETFHIVDTELIFPMG